MKYIERLKPFHRILHVFMAVSFLGLVLTGMPLRYSYAPWADLMMHLLGGYEAAGLIHRICALITFGYFVAHISYVTYYIAVVRRFRFNLLGPESMIPRWKDFQDIFHHLKWFRGKGTRPKFDRWTYWEKFDYWAVFWGVGVIGASGLLLWFPEFFGRIAPGWIFNVAQIIHSDEALLAAGFIFTIHFFNSHMRPEKFPMDTVIFTGTIPLEELEHERPVEYERLVTENRLQDLEVQQQPDCLGTLGILFGLALVCIGFGLLILIITGQFYYG